MTEATNLGDLALSADAAAPALIDLRVPGAPRTLTHGEVDAVADGIAASLTARGLPVGASIAILSANRWEYIAAYFGIMRAGLVAVPVNVRLPADTIGFVMDTAEVVLAYVDAAHAALVPTGIPTIDFDDPLPPGDPFATPPVRPAPGAIAQILFTSGSTGRPKGRAAEPCRAALGAAAGPGAGPARGPTPRHRGATAIPHERPVPDQSDLCRRRQSGHAAGLQRAHLPAGGIGLGASPPSLPSRPCWPAR